MQAPIPVRPVRPARNAPHLQRAAWIAIQSAIGTRHGGDPGRIARALYGEDGEVPALLLRSATGASTTNSGWAAELVSAAVADFLSGLVPGSAIAALIAARSSMLIPIGQYGSIIVPSHQPVAQGGWMGEGQPISAAMLPITPTKLTAGKAGLLVVISREIAQFTQGEVVFTTMLRETAAAIIDALYLSTVSATAGDSPGLLFGVTPLVSAGSALADLSQLARAVGGTAGSGQVIFIASPGTAAALSLNNTIADTVTILASVAVPPTRLICVDPASVVHAISPVPSIDATEESTIHMSDAPANIGAVGSPPVVAAPTQSMFQTSTIALRLIIDLAFAKRRVDGVAFIDAISWS